MKIMQSVKRLSILFIFIFSTLLFMNSIPSFADGNLNYYYDNNNRLLIVEDTATGKTVEYQYDESGNRTQKTMHTPSTITATAGSNGSISPGPVIVPYNFTQSFTITPAEGYLIQDVLVDGVSVGAVASYAFSNVTADHTISASFVLAYTIAATAGSNGSISPSGSVVLASGSSKTYTITPAERYLIADVLVDGVSVGAVESYTFNNITADHQIIAAFVHIADMDFCSGGTATTDGAYTVRTFTSNGTFTCLSALTAEILVVAGGGGGAAAGGGGAGGLLYNTSLSIAATTPYPVTVGDGGTAGSTSVQGGNGGNSVFSEITAIGGGGGGKSVTAGSNGGSGGGGGTNSGIGGVHAGGSGIIGQGYAGGATPGSSCSPCGGGGGAGEAGGSPYTGGVGLSYSISGTSAYYAGGGGGGSYCASYGAGGLGGGGNGSVWSTGGDGIPNTGGGGGGGQTGGAGGSGIVIVRYATPVALSITATAGNNGSITPAGVVQVSNGSNQTFFITPATGYVIADVLVDDVSVGAVESYTFTNVTANHSISATFISPEFTLTVLNSSSESLMGINCYAFTESGTYLGLSGTTNSNGQVSFKLADGSYKFRVDYLGYQFWTDVVTVPTTMSLAKTIEHQNVNITVQGSLSGSVVLKSGVPAYLFTSSGSYMSVSKTTDSNGLLTFNVPQQVYKVRADYLGQQFWSEEFTWTDKTIVIPEGTARIHVTGAGLDLSNVPVYVFSASGSYLSINGTTDTSGIKDFRLPAGSYRFRVDYQENQYWATATISQDVVNTVELSTGGGKFTLAVDTGSGPLAGVNVYLFNSSGSYLSASGTSDTSGQVSFNLADGNYKFRVDYLGYQFWTDVYTVPTALSGSLSIPHQDVSVTVQGSLSGNVELKTGIPVYLFTPPGSYLSLNQTTDSNGKVTFNVPQQVYKVRADYLGQQYWSEEFTWTDKTIVIPEGTARIHVTGAGLDLSNVPVYVFSVGGSYLSINGTTDTSGIKDFRLPAGSYKFRADYQGNQYWATATISQDVVNAVELSTGGGKFTLTVDTGSGPLAGVNVYLFNSSGSYLSASGTSDTSGQVSFNLADGNYKFRVDYLGYQFWTDVYTVPTALSGSLSISHQDITVTVEGVYQGSQPLAGVKVYLFTPAGSYLSKMLTTNDSGQVSFNLPNKSYKVRADYLSSQFWSGEFQLANTTVSIQRGIAQITAKKAENLMSGLKVYLFSESGSYLSLNTTTNTEGIAEFLLPNRSYKFRVDEGSSQHWSAVTTIAEGQVNSIEVNWD